MIETEGRFTVAGLVGRSEEVGRADSRLSGPRHATTTLPLLAPSIAYALIAVGQIKTPEPRMRLFEPAAGRVAVRLPCIVSPRAYVSRHATLGAGTIVMHGAVVNAGAVVGPQLHHQQPVAGGA